MSEGTSGETCERNTPIINRDPSIPNKFPFAAEVRQHIDANTNTIASGVQLTHTTTNTDSKVPTSTLYLKHIKFANAATDTTDIVITSETSVVNDDDSDAKSLHSVNSQLDEIFYDPVRNGTEVEDSSNDGHYSVQDLAYTKDSKNNAKNENHCNELKSSKPILLRCERSRAPSPKKVIQKVSNNKLVSKNKKNAKDEINKGGKSPPKTVVNDLSTKSNLEDSHYKSHQNFEKELWEISAQKKVTRSSAFQSNKAKGSPNSQANEFDEHCKSRHDDYDELTKVLNVSNKRKVNLGSPNFHSKLTDEHCKSHKSESLKSEKGTPKTPRSRSPWTKATPVLKVDKLKATKLKAKQIKTQQFGKNSKSPRSTPSRSPRTPISPRSPRCPRDKNPTPLSSRHYNNPNALKSLKACVYKPNAEHPYPWIMPSPNVHYDDIEVDSLPTTPRYCSHDKEPLPRKDRRYSPRVRGQPYKLVNESDDSSSPSCFGLSCGEPPKKKEINDVKELQHKKIADYIVQDFLPLKLSKNPKSLQSSPPSKSPPMTPRKPQIPPIALQDQLQQRVADIKYAYIS